MSFPNEGHRPIRFFSPQNHATTGSRPRIVPGGAKTLDTKMKNYIKLFSEGAWQGAIILCTRTSLYEDI